MAWETMASGARQQRFRIEPTCDDSRTSRNRTHASTGTLVTRPGAARRMFWDTRSGTPGSLRSVPRAVDLGSSSRDQPISGSLLTISSSGRLRSDHGGAERDGRPFVARYPGLVVGGRTSGRIRREDREPRKMATSTRSSVRTRIAGSRTAKAPLRRRRMPSGACYDTTGQPGAVAEFHTRVSHLVRPRGDRPSGSTLGRKDERIRVRVAPSRTSATG